MITILSIIVLFLNFITIYNDIKLDLHSKHSKTFLRKNSNGIISKLFFTPYLKDIKKHKYFLLIVNYVLSFVGFIFQLLITFDILGDNNIFLIGFVRFMIIYNVTLFIYKSLVSRIFSAMSNNDSLLVYLLLFCILIYVIIFIIVPIFQRFVFVA